MTQTATTPLRPKRFRNDIFSEAKLAAAKRIQAEGWGSYPDRDLRDRYAQYLLDTTYALKALTFDEWKKGVNA